MFLPTYDNVPLLVGQKHVILGQSSEDNRINNSNIVLLCDGNKGYAFSGRRVQV
jgi:hypothetical protein